MKAYKVFSMRNGELYPPMVPNPDKAPTPIGKWIPASAAPIAGYTKTGRPYVLGYKGQRLAYRPGWHLGELPIAEQFFRKDPESGEKILWPENYVWAECEYETEIDYQNEAMSYGYSENGKFRHSYAGLPYIPEGGFYRYRTNPNTQTATWIITGGMRVDRILDWEEVCAILKAHGLTPPKRTDEF